MSVSVQTVGRIGLLVGCLLLVSCTFLTASQAYKDGRHTGQWASGQPGPRLRFDSQQYLTDATYRSEFERGLDSSYPNWPLRDGRPLVRHLLRLDELRAQAEAAAHDKPTP